MPWKCSSPEAFSFLTRAVDPDIPHPERSQAEHAKLQ
jgi:hypothetical protein